MAHITHIFVVFALAYPASGSLNLVQLDATRLAAENAEKDFPGADALFRRLSEAQSSFEEEVRKIQERASRLNDAGLLFKTHAGDEKKDAQQPLSSPSSSEHIDDVDKKEENTKKSDKLSNTAPEDSDMEAKISNIEQKLAEATHPTKRSQAIQSATETIQQAPKDEAKHVDSQDSATHSGFEEEAQKIMDSISSVDTDKEPINLMRKSATLPEPSEDAHIDRKKETPHPAPTAVQRPRITATSQAPRSHAAQQTKTVERADGGSSEMPSVDSVLKQLMDAQSSFETEAKRMQAQVAQAQQEQRGSLDEKKAAFEGELADQVHASELVIAENRKLRTEIREMGRANEEIQASIHNLHEQNRVLVAALQGLGPKVKVAKQFTSETLEITDGDKDAALRVLEKPEHEDPVRDFLAMAGAKDSLLQLPARPKALPADEPTHGAQDALVTALSESLEDLSMAEAQGEMALEARFQARREAGAKRHAELLAQQESLNSTKKEMVTYQEELALVRRQLKRVGSGLRERLGSLVTFAQNVDAALNKTLEDCSMKKEDFPLMMSKFAPEPAEDPTPAPTLNEAPASGESNSREGELLAQIAALQRQLTNLQQESADKKVAKMTESEVAETEETKPAHEDESERAEQGKHKRDKDSMEINAIVEESRVAEDIQVAEGQQAKKDGANEEMKNSEKVEAESKDEKEEIKEDTIGEKKIKRFDPEDKDVAKEEVNEDTERKEEVYEDGKGEEKKDEIEKGKVKTASERGEYSKTKRGEHGADIQEELQDDSQEEKEEKDEDEIKEEKATTASEKDDHSKKTGGGRDAKIKEELPADSKKKKEEKDDIKEEKPTTVNDRDEDSKGKLREKDAKTNQKLPVDSKGETKDDHKIKEEKATTSSDSDEASKTNRWEKDATINEDLPEDSKKEKEENDKTASENAKHASERNKESKNKWWEKDGKIKDERQEDTKNDKEEKNMVKEEKATTASERDEVSLTRWREKDVNTKEELPAASKKDKEEKDSTKEEKSTTVSEEDEDPKTKQWKKDKKINEELQKLEELEDLQKHMDLVMQRKASSWANKDEPEESQKEAPRKQLEKEQVRQPEEDMEATHEEKDTYSKTSHSEDMKQRARSIISAIGDGDKAAVPKKSKQEDINPDAALLNSHVEVLRRLVDQMGAESGDSELDLPSASRAAPDISLRASSAKTVGRADPLVEELARGIAAGVKRVEKVTAESDAGRDTAGASSQTEPFLQKKPVALLDVSGGSASQASNAGGFWSWLGMR